MPETGLKIRLLGDPILKRRARLITKITPQHCQTLAGMARLMYEAQGVGLAAPQVGIAEAMIVADAGSGLYKLINPRVIRKKDKQVNQEGCLSVPGVSINVKRAREVVIQAQDETGKPVTIEAKDLLACVLQHEIDHLKGKTIVDYASIIEKLQIKKKLEDLRQKAKDEKLPESETKSCRLQL